MSEADRAAEEAIREAVAASGRGESVLGEEFGDDGGDAKWIVDPIDGTKNYVRGLPVWATLPLTKKDLGTWYYRVRGLNGNLPGTATTLTWSKPVAIRITGDRFVVGG